MATRLEDGVSLEDLINHFYDICKQLKRLEVVRALCVLEHGTVFWSFHDHEAGEVKPAAFMLDDLYFPLVPCYARATEAEPAMFSLFGNLFMHLCESVLAPEDLAFAYSNIAGNAAKVPKSADIALQPDPEWIDSLKHICNEDHVLWSPRGDESS